MLTLQGWLLLIGSALLATAGRLLGVDDLLAVGIAGAAVAAGSVVYVRVRPPLRLTDRSLHPQRVHAGGQCRVQLRMSNTGRLRSPVLRLTDQARFSTGDSDSFIPSPDLLVPPVGPGREQAVSYRLPTHDRGRVVVGPLILTVADPLGMSARRFQLGGHQEVLIYPQVVDTEPPARLLGETPDAARHSPMARSGEEFYGLRPFQTGDDPRRIHWRSAARRDELVVRQFEEPSRIQTTVLLDTRRSQLQDHNGRQRFEAMVSTAASICRAACRRGDGVRLATTAGYDSGHRSGLAHLHEIYGHLALVSPSDGSLAAAVEPLSRQHGGGLVVAVVADPANPGATESTLLALLGAGGSPKATVLFAPAEHALHGAPAQAPTPVPRR